MERDDYSESKRQKKRRHHLRCLYPSQETLLRRRQHHTIYSPLNFSLRSVPHGFNPFTITLPHNGSSQLTHRKISGTTLVEGSNPGTFIWGGLKALFKLAIVAALRVFVPKSWPPLQIASLFSLFLHWLPRPLKDFVPEAWTKHLSSHLDNTPPRPFSEVEYSIRQELLRSPQGPSFTKDKNALVPLGVVFSHVEKIPIAAASIAQVHAGFLKDGTRIVIKVQHLRMETMMGSDLRNLAWVARFLKNQLPVDLEPETIKRNLEKQNFRDIVCPIPYLNLCTKRLIVMQRLDGIRFTQVLCPNASEDLLARIPEMVGSIHSLLQAYGQMLFVDGVFHADPHAGNLLLLLDGRLGLLDYGQCKVLDAETRLKLAKIVLALSDNDDVEIARALLDAEMVFENITGDDISVSDFSTVARILFDVSYVEEATVSPTAQNSILRRTPLKSFNRALWLVVRAIFILRGLCFMLKIDTSAATIWRPYALVALQEKHS